MFLTTHYMDEADRVAQRIAMIDHGKIVAQGSPQELKRSRPARIRSKRRSWLSRDRRFATKPRPPVRSAQGQLAQMWRNRR